MRFWNRCFHSPERLVCYIKRQKSILHDFFYDLLHEDTQGYKGLRSVTGGCKGLQGLQGVKRGYRGLQEVTRGHKKTCFLTRLSTDSFPSSICIKIKVEEISNF